MNRAQRRSQWRSTHRGSVSGGRPAQAAQIASLSEQHGARPGSLRMNIAELVLRGFEKRDSDRIAAAFERRLHDLLRSGTLPASWRRTTRAGTLRIQPLVVHRSSNLAEIGERLAQAVFALRRDDRGGRDNT